MDTTINSVFTHLTNSIKNENKVSDISEKFAKLNNDKERVAFATKLLKRHNLLPCDIFKGIASGKCAESSARVRNLGNVAFQKKDDDRALLLYSQSVALAPSPRNGQDENAEFPKELSLAYANRSAVLYSMRNYEACVHDIDLAFQAHYPKNLQYKLLERKAKCMEELGMNDAADPLFKEAVDALSAADSLTPERKVQLEKEFSRNREKIEAKKGTNAKNFLRQQKLPEKFLGENLRIPCASECIEVEYNDEMGRYLRATTDIEPGDVILIEDPFASVLLPNSFYTHCHNCLLRCQSLIPCSQCSIAMYCGNDCRDAAWRKSHSVDCPLLSILLKLQLDKMAMLAVKIIILASSSGKHLNELLISLEKFDSHDESSHKQKGFDESGCYNSDDYHTIYSLVGNTEKRSVANLFNKSVTAACMLNCLEGFTNFFSFSLPNNSQLSDINFNNCNVSNANLIKEPSRLDVKISVGGLILRHLQNLPCNAHEVTECLCRVQSAESTAPTEAVEIGAAAYSTLSLLNHSCNPNVVRHSHSGAKAVLRAIQPIRKGEQILDNYGYHYAVHDLEERRGRLLSQYYFTCECEACENKWPLYQQLPQSDPVYKCSICGGPLKLINGGRSCDDNVSFCSHCKMESADISHRIRESSARFRSNLESVLSGKCDGYKDLVEHLKFLHWNIRKPWKEYNDCQEALKQCFSLFGNYYVTQSVVSVYGQ